MITELDRTARAIRLDPQDLQLKLRMETERARQGLAALKKGAIQPDKVLAYVLGGDATVTLESLRTGQHLTYRVVQQITRRRNDHGQVIEVIRHPMWRVLIMTGSDNTGAFEYLGTIATKGRTFRLAESSTFSAHDPATLAFDFVLRHAVDETQGPNLAVWHDGRCGRCRRTLTVPTSLETGIGPVCELKEKVGKRAKLRASTKAEGRARLKALFSSIARERRAS